MIKVTMNFLLKLFNKLNTYNHGIFETMYTHLAKNYTVYYDSFGNNLGNKEMAIRRKVLYYSCLFISFIQLLNYSILAFNHEPWVQVMLGDVTFLFLSQYAKVNALWFAGSFILFFAKIVVLYYERSADNSIIKVIRDLMKKSNFFKLTKNNENRLILRTNILYWLYLKLFCEIGIYLTTIVYIRSAFLAYFCTDYQFTMLNLLVLVMATILKAISLKVGLTASIGGMIFVYILTNFLLLKIEEIIKSIRVNIRWRNKIGLLNDIRQYDQFIKVIDVISHPINMVVGLHYLMLPYMSTQVWKIFTWETDEQAEKLLKLAFIIVIQAALFNLVMINYFAALLDRRNKSMHKYFYLVICDKVFVHGHTSYPYLVELQYEAVI